MIMQERIRRYRRPLKVNFNINFQYTAVGTLQQNGKVEQKIATLYSKVFSIFNLARMNKGLWHCLWAKCASHVTNMENIIVWKANDKSAYEKFYYKPPRLLSNIRFFGKIGIVRVYNKKIKAKLEDSEIHYMFIGYSKYHKYDCRSGYKSVAY